MNYSEEEIIKEIQEELKSAEYEGRKNNRVVILIQSLLDLYEKEKLNSFSLSDKLNIEKEKNKELIEGQIKTLEEILQPQLLKKYVSKDKIKERYEKLKHYDYIEINELLKLLEE